MKVALTESTALLQEFSLTILAVICPCTSACHTCLLMSYYRLPHASCVPQSTLVNNTQNLLNKTRPHVACAMHVAFVHHERTATPGHVRVYSKACMSQGSAEEWGCTYCIVLKVFVADKTWPFVKDVSGRSRKPLPAHAAVLQLTVARTVSVPLGLITSKSAPRLQMLHLGQDPPLSWKFYLAKVSAQRAAKSHEPHLASQSCGIILPSIRSPEIPISQRSSCQ